MSKERIINELFNKNEKLTERYIEAEKFILDLNWIQRIFCYRKINRFIKSRSKYKF